MEKARLSRAEVAVHQEKLDAVLEGLAKLRKDNDRSTQDSTSHILNYINDPSLSEKERLRTLREGLATRRRTLSEAKLLPLSASLTTSTARITQDLISLSATISRARSGLVQELVEVFNIVEVGGRPPIGGKAGTKGEWTIGDLILPVPGDIRSP